MDHQEVAGLDLNPENTSDRHHRKYGSCKNETVSVGGSRPIRITITYDQAIGFHNNPEIIIHCQFPKTDIFKCRTF